MPQVQGRKPTSHRSPEERAAPGGYQIVTLSSSVGVSQVFATLAGADRALPTIRQIYPDAYITQVSGFDVHRK